jgi:UDP:flavonoid glycosyltransferase YjiC (YdhE family)
MRVLFTSQRGSGHWHPLVPLAEALKEKDHEVAFSSTPSVGPDIIANGFSFFSVGVDESPEVVRERQQIQARSEPGAHGNYMQEYVFAGVRAERNLPELLHLIRDWRPDILVRENTEYAGYVAAESAGIPHAAFQITAFRPHLIDVVTEPLNRLHASMGLPANHHFDALYRYLLLTPRPPVLWNPDAPMPPTTQAFHYVAFNRSGEEILPDWIAHMPKQPTVYASLGTVFNHMTGLLTSILEALCDEPINLILSVGRNSDPQAFGKQPPNVHIERYIPQSLLLPYCNLLVTQGGSGTMLDALSHGLPMVMIPIGADQPENAQRCAELGVARVLGRGERSAQAIREAVREVLRNPQYTQNAQGMKQAIEAQPTLDYAVSLLERVAVERDPIIGKFTN